MQRLSSTLAVQFEALIYARGTCSGVFCSLVSLWSSPGSSSRLYAYSGRDSERVDGKLREASEATQWDTLGLVMSTDDRSDDVLYINI